MGRNPQVDLVDEAARINLMKTFIISLDLARVEVCYIQKIVTIGHTEGCAFVDCAVTATVPAVINGDNGVCRIHVRVPA